MIAKRESDILARLQVEYVHQTGIRRQSQALVFHLHHTQRVIAQRRQIEACLDKQAWIARGGSQEQDGSSIQASAVQASQNCYLPFAFPYPVVSHL
jgi:hypothetical protein